MDDRSVAKGVAAGRVLFGLVLLLAPRLLVRRTGSGEEPIPPYVWWLRAFGIRDAVLGAGALVALGEDDDAAASRWVQAGAAADALDAASVVVFGRDLDRRSRMVTLAVAVPAAAAGWRAAQGLTARR
ncbi:hypothetical protein PO878_02640 [Iamia majanohamensis]|uniref:DUF4267 domain-containing protein n=1 Tax=Iamia majanohamensis TaxID=467976 RepID=A0AAE9YAM7_9ACTN|nr:hypothetical protein [Iamia majanohamensis]WCO67618.1 hypothetical protein PO878_02640 [Iamia majanohamensis]